MSADNGYVIQKNKAGKFVLQQYFASNPSYPDPEKAWGNRTFNYLESAIAYYQMGEHHELWSEYGLTIAVPIEKKEENKMSLDIKKFDRKPFSVEAVRVTDENIEEVAKWSGGTVRPEGNSKKRHIKVEVKHPLSKRQTEAYAGDWVLKSHRGFKVYTDSALGHSFVEQQTSNVFNENLGVKSDYSLIGNQTDLKDAIQGKL